MPLTPEQREEKRRAAVERMRKLREARRAKGLTDKKIAERKGQLDELRKRKAREERDRRSAKRGGKRPARGKGSGAPVVKIPALAKPGVSASYPHLALLVHEWGPRFIGRYRHRYTGRHSMYVFHAAKDSLPERPTELEFRAWFLALRQGDAGKRYAVGTVNRFRETLFSLYEFARVRGGPWHNPLADVEPLQDDAVKAVPLNEKNVRTYFERAMTLLDDPRDRGLVAVLRYTGLRISEVLGLRAEDIDWTTEGGARLHVIRQRNEGTYVSGQLKHIRQRRFIRIHPELETRLREVLSLGPALSIVGSTVWGPNVKREPCPYLFPQRLKSMRRLAKKLKAMLPEGEWPGGQSFHAFRHAFTLEAYRKARMPLDEISKWLGHSSLSVTEKYLRDLVGYDTPMTALERLWAAQSGQPQEVKPERHKEGFDAGSAAQQGANRPATKSRPFHVLRLETKPRLSDQE